MYIVEFEVIFLRDLFYDAITSRLYMSNDRMIDELEWIWLEATMA
jgi:hypothetical protein